MQQSSNHKHSPWGLAQLARHWVEGGEVSRFNSQQVQEEKEKDVTYQEKKQFQAWVQFHWYVYKQTSHAWQKLDSWINKNRISLFFIFFFFWFNIRIEPEVHPDLNAFATMAVQLQKINILKWERQKYICGSNIIQIGLKHQELKSHQSCKRTVRSSRYIVFDRKSIPIVAWISINNTSLGKRK